MKLVLNFVFAYISLISAVFGNGYDEEDVQKLTDTFSLDSAFAKYRGVGKCGIRPIDSGIRYPFLAQMYNPSLDKLDAQGKIVGGYDAVYGEHPWQAKLSYSGRHVCGAVVINEHWLLTAAHCVTGQMDLQVTVGNYRLSVRDAEEQAFETQKVFVHPKYNAKTLDSDIALIKIQPSNCGRGIKFGKYVQPACLPDSSTRLYDGQMCMTSGWGRVKYDDYSNPEVLQAAELPLISNEECHKVTAGRLTDTKICAGYRDRKIGVSPGDSGGPLVCKTGSAYTIIGVASWLGEHCNTVYCITVSGFARVPVFLSWIHSTIKNNSKTSGQSYIPSKP